MHNPLLPRALETVLGLESVVIPSIEVGRSEIELLLSADDVGNSRHDTPALPPSIPLPPDSRATLTTVTGIRAGRLVSMDGAPLTIGRAPDADVVVEDTGVSLHHARIARAGEGTFYAEDLGSSNGTYVRDARIGVALLRKGDILQLGPLLRMRFEVIDSVEETLYPKLYESSVHDPLTHAFKRKYLNDRLVADVARARERGEVVVLMIDIDGFKDVNDRYGHLVGDRVLCRVATRIQSLLSAENALARWGGDEFVVVAVGASPSLGEELAERIRGAIEDFRLSARGGEVRVTASIGVAALAELSPSHDSAEALLGVADARMYGAKAAGKNRVCAVDASFQSRRPPSSTWTKR